MMVKLEHLITSQELYHLSVIPKADITIQTHFACKNLEKILDKVCGA